MAEYQSPEWHPAFEEYCETIFELREDDVDVIQARIAERLGRSTEPQRLDANPFELERSVLDASLLRSTWELPPWTSLAEGLEHTLPWYEARASR